MLFHVRDIPVSGKNFNVEITKEDLTQKHLQAAKIHILKPLHLHGQMYKNGRDVVVRAKLFTVIDAQCHRCLDPFPLEINSSFELYYQPGTKEATLQAQLEAEEQGILYYWDEKIDLTKGICDTIVLETPMKLLCSEDCQGLCPICGTNLNHEECSDPQCYEQQQHQQSNNPFKEFFSKNPS